VAQGKTGDLKLQSALKSLLLKAITILYDGAMKTLFMFLITCCFGSAVAQSNLPPCEGEFRTWSWTNCHGTQIFSNGNKYVGEYSGGKIEGQGHYIWNNGDSYVGQFKDGLPHGRGEEIFDGRRYVGEFRGGAWNGQGLYLWDDGQKYVGEFKDNEFNGQGVRFLATGGIFQSGIWANDKLVLSKFIDLSKFTNIPNLSKFLPNLDQLKTAKDQTEQVEGELANQVVTIQKPNQLEKQKPPQDKRVALVIGNAKYKFNPLNNPVNDATDMAASLRSVGFDVIEVRDATLKQMREATRRFADKLEVSDVGLVYYSGHGIEVKGTNYLIPVNADIRREYEVVDQAFDASNLLRMMESLQGSVKKRVNILIVDACRNNDLPKSWRSTNNGLARMDAPAGSFISFATAPGQVASDGNGRNSPYTKHLLNALKQPNVPIEQVFKQVRRNVMDETGGEQVPWENSSLIGDFYFTVAR
jgi:hypothetical protein